MNYSVEILRSAQKQLARLNTADRIRVASSIRQLSITPRPPGAKKLTNRSGWRIRIGDYRVIYEIEDDRLFVLVVEIGHRSGIY